MTENEVIAKVAELSGVARPGRAPAGPASPAGEGLHTTNSKRISLVELTGGEPLLQPEVIPLAEKLIAAGYTVLMETSGERLVSSLPREVIKILDVKCPDSGAADTFRLENLAAVDGKDEIKFVISSRRDYDFARDFTFRHGLAERVHQVIFSPVHADPAGVWPGMDPQELTAWILADGLPVRLGLQLHKIIWHPATRGV